jgi:hypothetical protein
MKAARPFLLLLAFIAVGYYLSFRGPSRSRAQSQSSPISSCCSQVEGLRELDFPYYSLREGFVSELYLVSTIHQAIDVTLAIYGQHGASVTSPATIQPSAKLAIDLRTFLRNTARTWPGNSAKGASPSIFGAR